ncbi:lipase family protein [Nocardia macrotermitis]|uniref:Putative inactive lipase n=1 Tax=Nocardia macrotermitis TaxID=2585198 RepID=A0A7K0CVC9_9NOCA|nr:lipase family protein [Nocardia macrotermitis]MQY17470.1 putative inactive lipase [Nocardia macrotermitis]
MRTWRVLLIVIALVCGPAAGVGYAGPIPAAPNPPALPAIPALPGINTAAVQQWINAVVPAPPIVPPPDPIAAAPGTSADLVRLQQAVMPSNVGDPMFDQWPANLAAETPGAIIAARDVTATAAAVLAVPVRQALLLKFRTTDAYGGPSFATATLVIPATAWSGPGERPVVVNNLAIDALGRACTPGYTLAHGFNSHSSAGDDLPPTTQLAVLRGYAVLIPDHEGPRMAYAEPYVAGHAVLDSIRAVRNLRPEEFGASRFAMHGYSGGAIATRGAVGLIDSYAPELATVIVGAALGGVPVDYRMLAGSMNANLASGIFLAATFGVARERPEILGRMNNLARWAAISPLKDTCDSTFAPIGLLMLPADVAADMPDALHSPLADRIYAVTAMNGMKSPVPLYVYQGQQEFWIPAQGAHDYYLQQCALGARAQYRSVLGEHLIADALGYPEAAAWLDQRLQGIPAPDEC